MGCWGETPLVSLVTACIIRGGRSEAGSYWRHPQPPSSSTTSSRTLGYWPSKSPCFILFLVTFFLGELFLDKGNDYFEAGFKKINILSLPPPLLPSTIPTPFKLSLPLFIPNLPLNPWFPGVLRACGSLLPAWNQAKTPLHSRTRACACTPAEKVAKDLPATPTQTYAHINIHTRTRKQSCRAKDARGFGGTAWVCVSVVLSCKTYNLRSKLQNPAVRVVRYSNRTLQSDERALIVNLFNLLFFSDTISDLLDQQLVRPNRKSRQSSTVKWPGNWVA